MRARVIPCLLLKGNGLVKTVGFADPKYVGDPINAVRIFNDKEVDELVLLDIEASRQKREPNYAQIEDIVNEAFMPIAYGGGVSDIEHASRLVNLGVEKIVVNHASLGSKDLITAIADRIGSQGIVAGVDAKKDWRGRYRVFDAAPGKLTSLDVIEHVREATAAGAGEIFLNDVARDGTGKGYDVALVRSVCESVNVPVIACGGAGSLDHLREAVAAGASAVAAGSMFVYVGKHRAVMINYPQYEVLKDLFKNG